MRAAKGYGGETIHTLLNALIKGDRDLRLEALNAIGYTSGWDAFAGVLTALTAYLECVAGVSSEGLRAAG